MAKQLTQDEADWAHECVAAGDSFAEIGEALEISAEQLRSKLKLRRAMSEEEAEVASLLSAGVEHRDIGALLGRSSSFAWCVSIRLKALGYRMPSRRGPPKERIERIAVALSGGETQSAIRRRENTTRSVVASVARRLRDGEISADV